MNSSVLDTYDALLVEFTTAMALRNFLEDENRALKTENDSLMQESSMCREIISNKDEEIAKLHMKNLSTTKVQTAKINEFFTEV